MEEQEEYLLRQLETQGKKIAKYRKLLTKFSHSSQPIDCSRMLHICHQLNKHIAAFDRINQQLVELEAAC